MSTIKASILNYNLTHSLPVSYFPNKNTHTDYRGDLFEFNME